MLTEAFKVIIKNANEAIQTNEKDKLLEIDTIVIDQFVCINISDNGKGIAPNDMERIFEMRFSTNQSGLGFGLYWTKDYIEGLGGSISVESELGKGTKFTIRLPVAKENV